MSAFSLPSSFDADRSMKEGLLRAKMAFPIGGGSFGALRNSLVQRPGEIPQMGEPPQAGLPSQPTGMQPKQMLGAPSAGTQDNREDPMNRMREATKQRAYRAERFPGGA